MAKKRTQARKRAGANKKARAQRKSTARKATQAKTRRQRVAGVAALPAKELEQRRARALEIATRLKRLYPDARPELNFSNPLELLVATVLSAQCTDERVNQVTAYLFQKYRTAADYMKAPRQQLEDEIRPTGFYRRKAELIQQMARALVEKFGGEVPRSMEELTQLPGVGRKTANVVLGAAMGIPSGIVVDTHVQRVARRLGLTEQKNPDKIEQDLMQLLPQEEWIGFGMRLILHGRRVCTARKPKCEACALEDLCPKIGVATAKKQTATRPRRR